MSMQSHAHRGIFRTKLNIYDGAFFTSVKPYFKNVLNSIELHLSSLFYTTHPFVKKLTTLKTQKFSCEFCEISWNTFFTEHPWATASEEKRFFKLAPNKSVKTACVCIAFFFHYFKYYGQNIFSRITVLYLIAKVERKE